MRRASWSRWGLMVTVLGVMLALVVGCSGSGSDPLDEIGRSYYISSIQANDRGTATTDIDLLEDCPTGDDPITKAAMDVTIAAGDNASEDIWLYNVRIDYGIVSRTGNFVENPHIPSVNRPLSMFIPLNGSGQISVDLLTLLQKEDYRELIGGDAWIRAENPKAEFKVTVTAYMTFTPDDPKNHHQHSYTFTINLLNFLDESCPAVEE